MFARSGGKGGQNVNKVNSKAELYFEIEASNLLSEEQKQIIRKRLFNKLNKNGELIFVSQKHRTQIENKLDVKEKFLKAIHDALLQVKQRKKSAPTQSSKAKRMESKKKLSEKKAVRAKKILTEE